MSVSHVDPCDQVTGMSMGLVGPSWNEYEARFSYNKLAGGHATRWRKVCSTYIIMTYIFLYEVAVNVNF